MTPAKNSSTAKPVLNDAVKQNTNGKQRTNWMTKWGWPYNRNNPSNINIFIQKRFEKRGRFVAVVTGPIRAQHRPAFSTAFLFDNSFRLEILLSLFRTTKWKIDVFYLMPNLEMESKFWSILIPVSFPAALLIRAPYLCKSARYFNVMSYHSAPKFQLQLLILIN